MSKTKKVIGIILGGTLALALAFGAFAVTQASAAEESAKFNGSRPAYGIENGDFTQRGGPGDRGPRQKPGGDNSYLADVLGITVEELQAAHQAALETALADAVEAGEITQEQADEMLERGRGAKRS